MSTVVDLQSIVEDWAKDYFMRKADKKEQRRFDKGTIVMDTDWRRVRFYHEEPKYEPEVPKPGTGKPTLNTLYQTSFTNKTDNNQTYNFNAQRSTRSECTVEIEESFTKGVAMEVKLATPCEIMEANAGFTRELTLTNVEGETLEEELSWGVQSEIVVPGRHRAQARLIITEEEYNGKFTIRTRVRGRIRVVFNNIKDNNAFVRAAEGDIDEVVRWAIDKRIVQGEGITLEESPKCVLITTKGMCKFKYGLKQDVEVDHKPI